MGTALLPARFPAAKVVTAAVVAVGLAGCVGGSVGGIGEVPVAPQELPASGRQLVVSIVDSSGAPLPGATVTFTDPSGARIVVSDQDGQASYLWEVGPVTITAQAPGLLPGEAVVVDRPEAAFSLALRPVVLRGSVVDPAGYPLSGASITSQAAETFSGLDGGFELSRAVPGEIVARRPARATSRAQWTGDATPLEIVMGPRVVRALHVGAGAVADPSAWADLLALADRTVVDGLVIDLKDDTGRVFHDSGVQMAREIGAVMEWFRLQQVLGDLSDHDLYAVARLVAFIDPLAARSRPAMAVWDQARDGPYVSNSLWYLDPTDEEARGYAVDLALEACRAGFDEIQLDHVAFPATASGSLLFDSASSESERASALHTFAAEAATRLGQEGCAVAVNVLGSTMTVDSPGNIGQDFAGLSEIVHVLAPTVYPSHYSENWFGIEDPSSRPGRVVSLALEDGLEKLAGPAVVRPWLQDFSYRADAVRAQIESAEDHGLGWMLWNGQSVFTEEALDREPRSAEPGP